MCYIDHFVLLASSELSVLIMKIKKPYSFSFIFKLTEFER